MRKEVKIGLFALVMIAGLYWAVNFIKGEDLLSGNKKYIAKYEQIGGLQQSAGIFIKGLKVGTVSNIDYDPQKSSDVIITLNIKGRYQIPVNSTAKIFNDGVMGGKAIQIVLGDDSNFVPDGGEISTDYDRDFMEVAGSEFEYMKQRFNRLANQTSETLETLNTILKHNSTAIHTTMTNLAKISGSVNGIVSKSEGDIRDIIENMNVLTTTFKDNSNNISNIVGNIEGITDSLRNSDIPILIDNLGKTLGEVNLTLSKINNGDGSLSKVINDNQLYDSLLVATSNLSLLLENIREHPSRYVSFSLFGKKEKEKETK